MMFTSHLHIRAKKVQMCDVCTRKTNKRVKTPLLLFCRWRTPCPTWTKWSCSLEVSHRFTMTFWISWKSLSLRGEHRLLEEDDSSLLLLLLFLKYLWIKFFFPLLPRVVLTRRVWSVECPSSLRVTPTSSWASTPFCRLDTKSRCRPTTWWTSPRRGRSTTSRHTVSQCRTSHWQLQHRIRAIWLHKLPVQALLPPLSLHRRTR